MQNITKTTDNKISLEELLPGDILVFKGKKDDLISRLIMALTNGSDVSHGAIFVQKKDFVLAEAGSTGIHAHQMYEVQEGGSEVYVMRHKMAGKDGVEPVVPIAKDYVLQDLPYPYSDLILLGLILIFKHGIKKKFVSSVVAEFLCLVAAELKTIIENTTQSGRHTMVCSSYVYQCYLDASDVNPDLKLQVKNGDVGFKELSFLGGNAQQSLSLFDLYVDYADSHKDECKKSFCANVNLASAKTLRPKNAILADLEKLLSEENEEPLPSFAAGEASIVVDIVKSIGDVIRAFVTFMKRDDVTFEEMLEIARNQQAMFVTPNDLRYHLTNADYVGLVQVGRNGEDYDPHFREE